MEKNSAIARTHPPASGGAARWRVWIQYTPLFLLALAATLLAYAPDRIPRPLTLIPGLFFVFLFPGSLREKILLPSTREISLTRLPAFFVFSLAVWAIPATALRFLGGDWFV